MLVYIKGIAVRSEKNNKVEMYKKIKKKLF